MLHAFPFCNGQRLSIQMSFTNCGSSSVAVRWYPCNETNMKGKDLFCSFLEARDTGHTHYFSPYNSSCSDSQEFSPSLILLNSIYFFFFFSVLKIPFIEWRAQFCFHLLWSSWADGKSQIFNAHWEDIEQGTCNGFFISINPKETLLINTDFV